LVLYFSKLTSYNEKIKNNNVEIARSTEQQQ